MRATRLLHRGLMVAVGVALLAGYLFVAAAGYRFLELLWAARPAPGTVAVGGAVVVLLSGYLSYRFGTEQLLGSLDAVELPPERAPALYRRLDALCEGYGIDRPRVLVADLPTPNAFALGGGHAGTLVFDRSLLRVLDGDELEGILAHELAHLESYDALVQTLAVSAMRTVTGLVLLAVFPFVLVVTGFARATAWISGRPRTWPATVFGRLRSGTERTIMGVLSVVTLALLARSRRREYAADDRAASMTGKPLALARALRKIERYAEPGWGALSLLYVQNDENEHLTRLFATHPPTEERVARLLDRSDRRRDRA